jgi:hypothetical protein
MREPNLLGGYSGLVPGSEMGILLGRTELSVARFLRSLELMVDQGAGNGRRSSWRPASVIND